MIIVGCRIYVSSEEDDDDDVRLYEVARATRTARFVFPTILDALSQVLL